MKSKLKRIFVFLVGSVMVSSCVLGPEFKRPETKLDRKFVFVNQEKMAAGEHASVKWWERLGDETLNEYVTILLRDNLSLKESFQRMVQARQQVKMDQGGLFPSIGLGADAGRNFRPVNSFAIPGAGGGDQRFFNNSFGADVSASWELDLFGKIQQSVQSSKAELAASELDREALQQSLIAQLVKLRIASVVSNQLVRIAKENAENEKKMYEITRSRYKLGVKAVNLSKVYAAQKSFHASKAQVHVLERQLAQNLYALDVLLGRAPGTSKLDETDEQLPVLPKASATCLPIALLDRRPDLKASEFRLMAQNAGIGVAMADLYPSLSISGTLGYSSMKSSRFIASDQLAGSLLSSVTTKLFQGGALRANVKLQEAKAKQMAFNYSYQVLEALKEVEVALNADGELERELLHKKAELALLETSEKNQKNRYHLGVGTLKEWLQTKQETYQARQEWLQKVKARFDGRIDVYLSLGGDWFGSSKALSNKCVLTKIKR